MHNDYLPSYGQILAALDELPVAVRTARRMRGLSCRDAAAEIGTDGSTLWRFEEGRQTQTNLVRRLLAWLDRQKEAQDATEEAPDHG